MRNPLLTGRRILAQVAGHDVDLLKVLRARGMIPVDVDEMLSAFDAVLAAAHRYPAPKWTSGNADGLELSSRRPVDGWASQAADSARSVAMEELR
jgi:hypothetical protein